MPTNRFKTLVLGTNLTGTDNGDDTVTVDASGGTETLPASIVDAKGDLIAASAADTVARLAVGSNDQVLVADSGQTLGVKWAAVPGTSAFVPVSTIDAKGDLLVGTANDALDNLPVGTNTHVLTADSAQTMGVKWAAAPGAGSNAVATDVIWDTKGDLAVASGADAASKLAVGTNGYILTADSAQTLGVKWAAASGGALGYGTSLPGSPADGDEYVLVDSTTAPTYRWHLRYNSGSSSSYKWEFIGGTPIIVKVDTDESFTNSGAYQDPATAGPTVTVPNAGDYEYECSANLYDNAVANVAATIGLSVAGATPAVPDIVQEVMAGIGTAKNLVLIGRLLGRSASDALKMRYILNGNSTANGHARWRILRVRPIRVS